MPQSWAFPGETNGIGANLDNLVIARIRKPHLKVCSMHGLCKSLKCFAFPFDQALNLRRYP